MARIDLQPNRPNLSMRSKLRSGGGCLFTLAFLAGIAVAGGAAGAAKADPVADFYRGKTLSLIIGTSVGNDYDYRGRLIARFLGKHLPGEPTILPRDMPGAGGVVAMNYLAKVAPHDGTVLHMIMSNMPTTQAVGISGVEYDTRKFYWIGNSSDSPNVMIAWHTTGVTSIEQTKQKELIIGAPKGTAGVNYVTVLNALAGTKLKLVTGYKGGNEVYLAMERGELQARASTNWAAMKETRPQYVKDHLVNILLQIGLKRAPDLPNVPLLLEMAKTDADRRVMTFLSSDLAIARSLVTTPETPPERVAALRRAFDATMKDPEFLAAAAKARLEIHPMSGEDSQKIADSIVNTPPDVISRAKAILGPLLH